MLESTIAPKLYDLPLKHDCVDWRQFAPEAPLTPDQAFVLTFASSTEKEVKYYFLSVFTILLLIYRETGRWLKKRWRPEELGHAARLRDYLQMYSIEIPEMSLPERRRQGMRRWKIIIGQQVGAVIALITGLGPTMVALHMVWGYINEVTTMGLYQRLPRLIREKVLDRLLALIRPQEATHETEYRKLAVKLLEGHPRRQERVRKLIERHWSLVGIGLHSQEEGDRVIGVVFPLDDETIWSAIHVMDAKIAKIPGMSGSTLLEDSIRSSHRRLADRASRNPTLAA